MVSFLENILLGKQYIGIEFFSLNQEKRFAFLMAQKKKDELVISKSDIFYDLKILELEKSNLPAVIVFNNEHVLQKEVESTDANDRKLLQKAFPNLQADDFYYEIWRKELNSIISICRKAYIDEQLKNLEPFFKVTSISLGVSSISALVGLKAPNLLATNTQQIQLDAEVSTVELVENDTIEYDINGLSITNNYLLAFSAVLRYLLPISTTGTVDALATTLKENYNQKTFFDKGLKTGIAVLLILLLANFFLFTYYFDNVTEMDTTLSVSKSEIENIVKIKERIKVNEQKLESFNGNASSKSSLIINTIVKAVPYSILLSDITYHPLEKKIKEDEPVITQDSLITVSGSTLSNTDFTNWVAGIENIKPVNDVVITSFGKDPDNQTTFSLRILIKK